MVCSSKMCSCWTLDNERFSSDKIIAAEGDLNKILAAEMKARYLAVSSHLQGYCLRVAVNKTLAVEMKDNKLSFISAARILFACS